MPDMRRTHATLGRGARLFATGLVPLASLVLWACTTDYQLGLDDPAYGSPNALANQGPPGSSSDNKSADGGGVNPSSTAAKCVQNGGTLADGGTCTVSFSKDILPAFGTAHCADVGCHGGVTPANQPRVEPGDALLTWTAFQGRTLSDGKPYINPCSLDDKQSGMACNLYATGQAGACGVHMPQGGQIASDAIPKIETWLKCGSPNN